MTRNELATEYLEKMNNLLLSSGFKKEKTFKQSATFGTIYSLNIYEEICIEINGWHGTGQYGSKKEIHDWGIVFGIKGLIQSNPSGSSYGYGLQQCENCGDDLNLLKSYYELLLEKLKIAVQKKSIIKSIFEAF
jgi:hypothetical protein